MPVLFKTHVMRTLAVVVFLLVNVAGMSPISVADETDSNGYFGIHVVDNETQRGVPMVSLTTVDDVTYITDNAGWVALHEPELTGKAVFFKVHSPGYEVAKDGFGMAGVRLTIEPGKTSNVTIKRKNVAERIYRITGRDLYLDSVRLHQPSPKRNPLGSGMVVGQDSIQPIQIGDEMHWFWGDTNRLSYPLGMFRTAGAVSKLPAHGGLDPSLGINFEYFTNPDGFARAMIEVPDKEGVVWIHGVCTVTDAKEQSQVITQYSRRKGLEAPLEQGMALWNYERKMFEVLDVIDLKESWRIVRDHPIHQTMDGIDYLYFGNPFPISRVSATLDAVRDRSAYESFTCREELPDANPTPQQLHNAKPLRDAAGQLIWRWAKAPPVTQQDERRWVKSGQMKIEEARFLPRDADSKDRIVEVHAGTIHFNTFRNRWVMIANEQAWDKSSLSFLGEVFYSESDSPQGPFVRAVRIATHPGQSFYNPCHHPFFDQQDGRRIYFEGTYCNTFTESPATPRYNYNQMMYRLDLSASRITNIFGEAAKQVTEHAGKSCCCGFGSER